MQECKQIRIMITQKKRKKKEKGIRRMPRHLEAKKDVASCDKLRVDASSLRSEDFRMGQPILSNRDIPQGRRTQGTETSKYL